MIKWLRIRALKSFPKKQFVEASINSDSRPFETPTANLEECLLAHCTAS